PDPAQTGHRTLALCRSSSREICHLRGGAGEGHDQRARDALGQSDQDHLSTMEAGDDMTNQHQRALRWVATAGLLGTLALGGCASKSVMVTTSGAAPSAAAVATQAKSGPGEALKGFSMTPVEEQVT